MLPIIDSVLPIIDSLHVHDRGIDFHCIPFPVHDHKGILRTHLQVLSVQWKGDLLWGTIEILPTPSGLLLWELYSQVRSQACCIKRYRVAAQAGAAEWRCDAVLSNSVGMRVFNFDTQLCPAVH